jgi:hypothetical protein
MATLKRRLLTGAGRVALVPRQPGLTRKRHRTPKISAIRSFGSEVFQSLGPLTAKDSKDSQVSVVLPLRHARLSARSEVIDDLRRPVNWDTLGDRELRLSRVTIALHG